MENIEDITASSLKSQLPSLTTYSMEVKAFAKMLFLIVDKETGQRKLTIAEITVKLKEQFEKSPNCSTVGVWARTWADELSIKTATSAGDTVPIGSGDALVNIDQIKKAVTDAVRLNVINHSRRMEKYSELEDIHIKCLLEAQLPESKTELLKALLKKNPDANRINRVISNFKLADVQRGVTDSNKAFLTSLKELEKWVLLKDATVEETVLVENSTFTGDKVWEFEPVDIEEFLAGDEFLGQSIYESLFKCVKADLKEIFYGNPRMILERRRYKEVIFKESYGTGKSCLKTTTYVNSTTGKVGTIGELVERGIKEFDTWGLNPDTLKIDKIRVVDVLKTGVGVVYRLKLASGRHIDATANHQFFSDKGWAQLQDFKINDAIAIPRKLGDTENTTNLTDAAIHAMGCVLLETNSIKWSDSQSTYKESLSIPDYIMSLSNAKLKIFISATLFVDGKVNSKRDDTKNILPDESLNYNSNSELMIDQLMVIFQRLGFVLKKESMRINCHKVYRVTLCGKQTKLLLEDINQTINTDLISEDILDNYKSYGSDIFWDRVESIEKLPGIHDVYDCVVDSHHHNFIANGIITHNSIRAALIACYLTYLILCLRDPAKYFKLMRGSKITITNVAVTKTQAKDVVYFKLKGMIDNCPWFRNSDYMYDANNKLELRFDASDSAKTDPNKLYKNVYITSGSSSEFSAVGYDVICAIIDEATAYGEEGGKDKAEVIYDTFVGRIASRFPNTGMIVMAGNPHHVNDFLERRLRVAESDPQVYIIKQRSIWDAKMPDYDGDYFYFDKDSMKIVDEIERNKESVFRVPIVFQKEFESAPEKSTRNLAGYSLESISRFVTNVDKIDEMFENSGRRNLVDVITFSEADALDPSYSNFIVDLKDGVNCVRFDKRFKPINDGIHAVHIDIGVTGDACGIALGHISDYEKSNPIFYIDCYIRIKGSKSNPNILEGMRSIVYKMTELGFNIGPVSLDGYQSTDFIQIMKRKNYDAYLLSVDLRMTPYINMRQALYEGRINSPCHDFLRHELRTLENVNDKKVDHPLKGSKDLSDALCGVLNSLIEKVPIESVSSDKKGTGTLINTKGEEQIVPRTPEEIFNSQLNAMGDDV